MKGKNPKTYGDFVSATNGVDISFMDHPLGLQVWHDEDGNPETVLFQWETLEGPRFRQVNMDYKSASLLLSALKNMERDQETGEPEDNRKGIN